jgi:hypothetical protein
VGHGPSYAIYSSTVVKTFFPADFMNQKAHHLAEHFDPEGKRTIGMYGTALFHISS